MIHLPMVVVSFSQIIITGAFRTAFSMAKATLTRQASPYALITSLQHLRGRYTALVKILFVHLSKMVAGLLNLSMTKEKNRKNFNVPRKKGLKLLMEL
jgi:hypothetical protein